MSIHRLLPLRVLQEGVPHRCSLDGGAVLLCRVDGVVHAVDDRCPHEDISLSLGCLEGHYLRCPLHGSRFDIRDGRVQSPPAEDNLRVWSVRIDEHGDESWVVLERD